MSWYLATVLALPWVTAVFAFIYRRSHTGRWLSVIGSGLHVAAAAVLFSQVLEDGVVAAQMGQWAAPFGITLVADYLAAILVLVAAITGLTVTIYALGEINDEDEVNGFSAVLQILLGGITGAFLTGDLFNLYVWFEVMLISSFYLLTLGRSKEQIDGGVKYVALNLISTTLILTAIGMLYGMTGTLNMADLSLAAAQVENPGVLSVVAVLFIVAFGMKAAVFPLYFWLPAAYHTPKFTVAAIFAALLTKVGVYVLIRLFTLVFVHDQDLTSTILLWMAGATMLTGVLGAISENDIRRVLSYNVIATIGYMLMGLAIGTQAALLGAIFYLAHDILVKANLFMVAGQVQRLAGTTSFEKVGGIYRLAPLVAFLFFIPAFSLAGFPPLSGFWAKYLIVTGALDAEAWFMAFIALFVGLLTIYAVGRVWAAAFWTPHPDGPEAEDEMAAHHLPTTLIVPVMILTVLTIVIGLVPAPLIEISSTAAEQLLVPTDYIETVLDITLAGGDANVEVSE
ncbi:MAG: Na+/H+ antiporter subunit D [Rhodobacteraceae bacterium]|nr:Na+/H+ antiporter subunit D [Paracoccaceae bacterium]